MRVQAEPIAPQEELRQANAEIRLILDSITAILIGLDERGFVRTWNAHAEEQLGLGRAQALGADFAELELPLENSVLMRAFRACLESGETVRLEELSYRRPEGAPGYLGITCSPLRAAEGPACGCLMLGRDITEKKGLELQLARAQKLESLGELAAGIAHEINTPTQFVSDNTSFLASALKELEPLLAVCDRLRLAGREGAAPVAQTEELVRAMEGVDIPYFLTEIPRAIADSLAGLQRISGIVRAMKEFSHPGSGAKEPTDINRCIQTTTMVARNEWKYVAELELDLAPDLPRVPCYPQDINQVVLNMVVNAAHAIQEARTLRCTEELGRIRVQTRRNGNVLELRINDNGSGIPEAHKKRVFDPFFTTKTVGKGTGQGLAIAHHIVVDKHAGRLALESTVGVGTTFIVSLPLLDPQVDKEPGNEGPFSP